MAWSFLLIFSNFIKLFIYIMCIFISLGAANEVCGPGLTTRGVTIPKGDIIIEEGEPLEIYCKLHDNYVEEIEKSGKVASDHITFYRNNASLPEELIDKVNKSTIRLYQENPPLSKSHYYYCKNKNDGSAICLNSVTVGRKPQLVTDLSCYSENYKNLICTWSTPENYVKTNYTLDYYFPGRNNRKKYECPNYIPSKFGDSVTGRMKCMWDISSDPPYRQSQETYFFTLTMSNVFGNKTFKYNFSHFAHVIPGPPENLTYINRTSNSILLTWNIPREMFKFPSGLIQKVVYQCLFDNKGWTVAPEPKGVRNETYVYNLTGLKYAHALYDIRVSMRSAKALDELKSWSNFTSITIRTASIPPARPPRLNIGSFETTTTELYRNISVYWQSINENEKNGENLTYIALAYEENNRTKALYPVEVTNTYAKFTNLTWRSYTFNVYSSNEIGNSSTYSTLTVPDYHKQIFEPKEFYKIAFENGLYELSWLAPDSPEIISFTIFWCNSKRDRPFPCNGYLDWEEVPPYKRSHNVTLIENDTYHQFAISANTRNFSSGMLWASCTVLHDDGIQRMKTIWIDKIGSTFIEVKWNLECADKKANVQAYKISYCPIVSPTEPVCKGMTEALEINDPNARSGNVTNLKPYTTYMLVVGVLNTRKEYNLGSERLFNTTLEGVPDVPQNITLVNVTNDSITVKWSPPIEMNGHLKEYQIKIFKEFNVPIELIKTTDLVWTFKRLKSFTYYNISVEACTVQCSEAAYLTSVLTNITEPSVMEEPITSFRNSSFLKFTWKPPDPPNGRLDMYQLQVTENNGKDNKTTIYNETKLEFMVPKCREKKATYYYSVRAVNLDNDVPYFGKWSKELTDSCDEQATFFIYILIGGTFLFFAFVLIMMKKLWTRCKIMRDVEIKLPPGLSNENCDIGMPEFWPGSNKTPNDDIQSKLPVSTDEERLLKKTMTNDFHPGDIMNGDSSGCSSGKESVISSEESENNMSFTMDSGTEQPKTPSNDSISRENSLRLRKPGSDSINNHWNTDNWQSKKSSYVTIPTPEKTTTNWPVKRPVAANNYCVFGLNSEPETNPSYVSIGQNPNSYGTNVLCSENILNHENTLPVSVISTPSNPILSHNNQTGYSSIIPVNNFTVSATPTESLPYMQKSLITDSKIDVNNVNFIPKLLENDETIHDKTEQVDEILQNNINNEPAVINNSGANVNNTYCRLGLDSDNKGQIFVNSKTNVENNNDDKASSATNNASTSNNNESIAPVKPVSNYIPVDKVINYVPHRQFNSKED